MGKYLRKNKKCIVIGIETRTEESKIAKKVLNGVITESIEDKAPIKKALLLTKYKKFDYILCTSVIEHIANPDKAIINMLELLKPEGKLIITTPNVAHWSARKSLLLGRFEYEDYGIFDNTHLRFFTIKTFRELIQRNKGIINKLKIDAEGGGYPRISIFLSKFFPSIFAYQILIIAKKS